MRRRVQAGEPLLNVEHLSAVTVGRTGHHHLLAYRAPWAGHRLLEGERHVVLSRRKGSEGRTVRARQGRGVPALPTLSAEAVARTHRRHTPPVP